LAAALVLLIGGSIAFASQGLNHAGPSPSPVGAPPPPALTLLQPASTVTRASSIDLTAIAPANLRNDQQYQVRVFVNDTPVSRMDLPNDGQFTVSGVPLSEGDNSVRVTLVGTGGESVPSSAVIVTRDDTAPKITILDPTGRVYTDTDTLLGTTEPGADMQITDDSGHVIASSVAANGRFSADLTLQVGDNNLTLRSTDPAGNHATTRVTVVRASSAASIDLTVTPTEVYSADLPAPIDLTVAVRDELGRPVVDGTEVVFGVSPPDQATTTYSATTVNGRAHYTGLTIDPVDAVGPWLITALVTLPSGIELRDNSSFSLVAGAQKSPGQH
jgi:Bacterial Ig domain